MTSDLYRQLATVTAGLLYVIGVVPYLFALHQKKIKPHPISWLLWSIIGFVSFIFYPQTGATYTQLIAYTSFFLPLLIFIFSVREWEGSFSRVDYFCLGVSLLALAVGLLYKNPALGLSLNLLISDVVASIPTVIKTFKDPKSERPAAWLISVIANILTISVINKWTFAIVLFPVETFVINSTVLVGSLRKAKLKQNETTG